MVASHIMYDRVRARAIANRRASWWQKSKSTRDALSETGWHDGRVEQTAVALGQSPGLRPSLRIPKLPSGV